MPDDFIPRFSDEYNSDEDTQGQQNSSPGSAGPPELSWSPMKPGGTNFGTHQLKEVSHTKMAFRPTMGAQMFGGVFLAFGIGAFGFGFYHEFISSGSMDGTWALIIFGFIFGASGFFLARSFNRPIVFDKNRSLFWQGKAPAPSTPEPHGEDWAHLDRVAGLQLLAEQVSGSEDTYHSYELNLVLDDGQRIHVVDHGNADRMRHDAEKLSYFLGVPIYDQR